VWEAAARSARKVRVCYSSNDERPGAQLKVSEPGGGAEEVFRQKVLAMRGMRREPTMFFTPVLRNQVEALPPPLVARCSRVGSVWWRCR